MKIIFGLSSALVGIGAAIPYIRSIFAGKTKPHRVSWFIWLVLSIILLTSQIAKGAHWSLLLIVAAMVNDTIIFGLSIRHGMGGVNFRDRLSLGLALLGILLWIITRNAVWGLVFAIAADLIGTALTVEKAYKFPGSESTLSWFMAFTASVLGLLAVASYTFGQTLYPAYAVLGGGSIFLVSLLRTEKPTKKPTAVSEPVR